MLSSSFKFTDASPSPLVLEKEVVAFMICLTWPNTMLLPMLALLEYASYFTYSVPGLFPNHSKNSVNSSVMTIKNTEPSWIWKSGKVATTFQQFVLCYFNILHFLQVSAFLFRTLIPEPLAISLGYSCWGSGPSVAVGGPILTDNEQRYPGSTLTSV